MADIKITPEELLAQSAEMTSLQSEYESLFSQVTNALNGINDSWSENLARNFSGKIQSAQKSFTSITNMLANGSAAARLGATSHSPTSMDSYLSQLEEGFDRVNSALADSVRPNEYTTVLTKEEKQQIYDALPSEIKSGMKGVGDVDAWLSGNYSKIPESMRKQIESKLPSNVKNIVSVAHDAASGQADASTIGKAAAIVTGDSTTGKAVKATTEAIYNKKLENFDNSSAAAEEKAYNSYKSGDVGGGLLYTAEAFAYQTQKGFYALGDAATNMVGDAFESTKVPVISGFGSMLKNIL